MSDFRVTLMGGESVPGMRAATDPGRQTAREVKFADVFKAGVRSVVETGISLGTAVLPGGPFVNASVERAQNEAGAGANSGGLAGTGVSGPSSSVGSLAGASAGPLANAGVIDRAFAMQRESQAFNVQYLQLQEGLQAENRRFTTLSNMLKVRHDTAKAAISNIH